MAKQNRRLLSWRIILFFLLALSIIAIDQATKAWIEANVPLGGTYWGSGFLRIIHIQNTGASFGLFQGYTPVLAVISSLGALVILFAAFMADRIFPFIDNKTGMASLGLILGGTIGNLIDRVSQGYVTDFIYLSFWPTFNVADSSVVVGVIILGIAVLAQIQSEQA